MMMVLVVCGQDIRSISFGLARDGVLERETVTDAPPERYLARLDETLRDWNVGKESLGAVAVVTGPGSFTSSRVSTVIANSLAFAWNVPVIPLENPKRLSLRELVAEGGLSDLPPAGQYAVPSYDRPPHIT